MDDESKSLCGRLRALRRARGWSIDRLAESMDKAGVELSRPSVARYTSPGGSGMYPETRRQIRLYLEGEEHGDAASMNNDPEPYSIQGIEMDRQRLAIVNAVIRAQHIDIQNLTRAIGYDRPAIIEQLLRGERRYWKPYKLHALLDTIGLDIEDPGLAFTEEEKTKLWSAGDEPSDFRWAPVWTSVHAREEGTEHVLGEPVEINKWEGEKVKVPTDGRSYLCMEVEGDSMQPAYRPHDIVIGLRLPVDQSTAAVRDDVICIYERDGETHMVLKYLEDANDDSIWLSSYNRAVASGIVVPRSCIKAIARIVDRKRGAWA